MRASDCMSAMFLGLKVRPCFRRLVDIKSEPMTDDDRVNGIVGENIRRLRTERGLTRLALAEMAEFDDSYLGKMERGRRGTTSGGYQRLADALGVTVASLFEVRAGSPRSGVRGSSLARHAPVQKPARRRPNHRIE